MSACRRCAALQPLTHCLVDTAGGFVSSKATLCGRKCRLDGDALSAVHCERAQSGAVCYRRSATSTHQAREKRRRIDYVPRRLLRRGTKTVAARVLCDDFGSVEESKCCVFVVCVIMIFSFHRSLCCFDNLRFILKWKSSLFALLNQSHMPICTH